jgi:light-regulated signal transduction histidine kinase (bacteriophytochrome)
LRQPAQRPELEKPLKFARNVPQSLIENGGRYISAPRILAARDKGVGFDMKFHDRIFDILQRLHHSEACHGTGVGRALVTQGMQPMGADSYLGAPK